MTLCDNAERRKLARKTKRFIKDGKWVGAMLHRGAYKMQTKEARRRGMTRNRGTFLVAHIVLVANGLLPREDDQASHLCHTASCILVEHLVWERGDYNTRRVRCAKYGECCCRLSPRCIFGAH